MTYAKLLATGSYLPKQRLTNADLETMVETTDAWIVERTGIRERRMAAEDETAASLAERAARQAIDAAGIAPAEIDLILVATCSNQLIAPSCACLLQRRLDLHGCPAFDVSAACAGFSYGLSIADQYVRQGQFKTILLVGTEVISRIINWEDRGTCILFGDGAGAVILQAAEAPGIVSTHLHADGAHAESLYIPNVPSLQGPHAEPSLMCMTGRDVFKVAVEAMTTVIIETLQATNLSITDIDWLIPHQANLRIIQAIAKKLNFPMEKVIVTLDFTGNTSSASIPIALDAAVRDGRIQRGDRLLLESFGAGAAWGAACVTY